MNRLKNIAVFFLGIIFLVSATGVLIFSSHCSCSGNEKVSVYVSPDTCADNYHVHHFHNEGGEEVCSTAGECHECSPHTDDCGCDSPNVRYLKLDEQVVPEKVRTEKIYPVQLNVPLEVIAVLFSFTDYHDISDFNYIDPPPQFQSSTDFLIHIHKLKIPLAA